MAWSRLPLRVFSGGASSSARAWPSPSAGVLPSLPSAFGRLTPRTGLWLTALTSQRWSKSDATAASLRRMELGAKPRRSRSFRQAIPVGARDLAHFLRAPDAGEGRELLHVVAVRAPGGAGVRILVYV
jgi:hypothetical protein